MSSPMPVATVQLFYAILPSSLSASWRPLPSSGCSRSCRSRRGGATPERPARWSPTPSAWPGSSRCSRRWVVCTSPRSPTTNRAGCAGSSGSRCTRSPSSSASPTFRADGAIRIYGRVLAGIGAVIAAYHLALEWIPALDTGACGVGPACTLVWFRALGFVSLPVPRPVRLPPVFTLLSVRGDSAVHDDSANAPDRSWRTE